MGGKSTKELGERPLEHPLALPGTTRIIALQSNPPRDMGVMEVTGRVYQNDYNKSVVGWVDAQGIAYRNDFNRTRVGHVDLSTGNIYQADYNKTLIGRVDRETGMVYFTGTVVHNSSTNTPTCKLEGPKESYYFAGCAFLCLF